MNDDEKAKAVLDAWTHVCDVCTTTGEISKTDNHAGWTRHQQIVSGVMRIYATGDQRCYYHATPEMGSSADIFWYNPRDPSDWRLSDTPVEFDPLRADRKIVGIFYPSPAR